MRHTKATVATIVTAAGVVAVFSSATPVSAVPTPESVRVINDAGDPVPVTGGIAVTNSPTVNLGGPVSVSSLPAVTGTVGVTSLPPVTLSDNTVRIDPAANTVRLETSGAMASGDLTRALLNTSLRRGSSYSTGHVDVRTVRAVRMSLSCSTELNAPGCADVEMIIYGDAGGPLYLLDRFTLGAAHGASRVYDLPGTGLWVSIGNAVESVRIDVAIVGRAN